jgi:hypothetical protein
MKIKKEAWLVVAAVGFLLAWLIDRLAGPVSISVGSPIAFLKSTVILNKFPFTATAIIIRSLAIFISTMLVVSLFEKNYFTKAIVLFFVGLLAEFYAIQQLANGFKLTTIQWTLSIAYGSLLLTTGVVWMLLKGVWSMFGGRENDKKENAEKSVLEPDEDKD